VLQGFQQALKAHWDLERFKQDVLHSQACRHLVDAANRKGKFKSWDYQPLQDATQRYMRNHLDLNVLEANNRYPKP
jgi:choline-sulfatase